MQNAPTGSELVSPRKHHTPRSRKTSHSHKVLGKSLPLFLINTGIAPFVLAGKSMQWFGLRTVVSFVLGATLVYGYAFFKPLPYVKLLSMSSAPAAAQPQTEPEPPAKKIRLHGLVQDRDGRPLKEPFMVGVLVKRFGPMRNSDGSFEIEVPRSTSYDLALWNMGGQTFQLYDGYSPAREGDGYILPPMPFYQRIRETSNPDSKLGGRTAERGANGDY